MFTQTMTEKIQQRKRHDECERDPTIKLWSRSIICVGHASMTQQSNDIAYWEINEKWKINYINLFFQNPILFWALNIFITGGGQYDK